MKQVFRNCLLSSCFLVFFCVCFCGNAAAQKFDVWAILADKSLHESGLPDLLTAQLTEQSFQLVERSELDRVAGELKLAALTAVDASKRLRLGKLLKADVLVVISRTTKKRLRVVVCDCEHGARLSEWEVAVSNLKADETAGHIVKELQHIRRHFADGVSFVIGVPPFLCKNLEHDFDHLQSHWSNLLARSLSLRPGVAVIEVEEARAILKEQSLSKSAVKRVVPLIVNVEFRVAKKPSSGAPTAVLTVQTSKKRAKQDVSLELSKVAQWLAGDLAGQVLRSLNGQSGPLTVAQQKKLLLARANLFGDVGDWLHAAGLREAALLLDPKNAEVRFKLIYEYEQQVKTQINHIWHKGAPEPERKQRFAEVSRHFVAALMHQEYLIRNRLATREEAIEMFRQLKWHTYPDYNYLFRMDPSRDLLVGEMMKAERQFITTVFAKALTLPKGSKLRFPHVSYFRQPWNDVMMDKVLTYVQYRNSNAESLEYLDEVLLRVRPSGAVGPRSFDHFLRFQIDDVRARFAKFHIPRKRTYQRGLPKTADRTESLGRMRFQSIELAIERDGKEVPLTGTTIFNVIDCGTFDLVCTGQNLCLMKREGVLYPLPIKAKWQNFGPASKMAIVAWDGQWIWLARPVEQRIEVYKLDGTPVAVFDASRGLPSFTAGFKMLDVAPGKLLAVGSFGDRMRGWCAMLELDQQGEPSVRVFHEARQVVRIDGKGNEFAKDPASAFSPAWLHHYDDGTDHPKVLVGRRSLLQSKGLPLLINLRTLKASVDARALVGMPAEPANPFSFHSRGGHLLQCGGASVLHFAPGTRFPKKICLATTQRIGPYVTHNLRRRIIPSNDGWLYVPGYAWFRIHAETYEVQRLNQGMLPQPFRNVTWGTSSHYGLVGWLGQRPANAKAPVRIYDVTIAAKKK